MKTTKHGILSAFSKEQKEAVGLLQIGTFLEYFDLMLYVHMAVLLNDLFFPKLDSFTSSIVAAATFSGMYIVRPFSAFIFGYIGDNIGRKPAVIITTLMMALSCVIMGSLPTYNQIGISATWIMITCRLIQGISSMEEVIGAELYLTEISKTPERHPLVTSITIFATLGGVMALGIATLATSYDFNWRYAFFVGAGIALVGSLARTALKETPEFIDAKRKLDNVINELGLNKLDRKKALLAQKISKNNIVDKRTMMAYFLIQCSRPVYFYFTFIYSATILKNTFNYDIPNIVYNNFLISIIDTVGIVGISYLSYRICPLKIIKVKTIIFVPFLLLMPYLLNNMSVPSHFFLIQSFFCLSCIDTAPAAGLFYSHFPTLKRFTYGGMTYAISRAFMYVITSFGLVYLIDTCGNYGLLILFLPVIVGYLFGINYFETLEKKRKEEEQEVDLISSEAPFSPRSTPEKSRLDIHREEIIASLASGESKVSIARRLNTSQVNLYHWLKKRKIRTPKKR